MCLCVYLTHISGDTVPLRGEEIKAYKLVWRSRAHTLSPETMGLLLAAPAVAVQQQVSASIPLTEWDPQYKFPCTVWIYLFS